MSPTLRLALKIVGVTIATLIVGAAIVSGILIARAPQATPPEVFVQLGHSRAVNSVAWSPDGKTLASGSGAPGPYWPDRYTAWWLPLQ